MKLRGIFAFIWIVSCAGACRAAGARVDVLDYFLQTKPHDVIGGFNVHSSADPDGKGIRTVVLHKGSSDNSYEVYQITPAALSIRYEVVRPDPKGSANDWVRRYHELGKGIAPTAGMIWMPRFVDPGHCNFTSHAAVDRYEFDPSIGAYVIKPASSSQDAVSYNSVVWSHDPWLGKNQTGLKIDSVIRLISQWQPEGKIFETYDYARGMGIINWQWMERIGDLPPVAGDKTGKLFYCENGAVYVQSRGDKTSPPSVFQYDVKKGQIGGALGVTSFTSHWADKMGPQWYVVYRDLSREGVLKLKKKSLATKFALPEWYTNPHATIADLPPFFTAASAEQ